MNKELIETINAFLDIEILWTPTWRSTNRLSPAQWRKRWKEMYNELSEAIRETRRLHKDKQRETGDYGFEGDLNLLKAYARTMLYRLHAFKGEARGRWIHNGR